MYIENMKGLFQKIPVQLPKPQSLRRECQSLLHAIRDEYYMEKWEYSTTEETKTKQKSTIKREWNKKKYTSRKTKWEWREVLDILE